MSFEVMGMLGSNVGVPKDTKKLLANSSTIIDANIADDRPHFSYVVKLLPLYAYCSVHHMICHAAGFQMTRSNHLSKVTRSLRNFWWSIVM